MIWIIGWYGLGLFGSYLGYRHYLNFEARHERSRSFCPSPANLVTILLFALFGVVTLLIGLGLAIIDEDGHWHVPLSGVSKWWKTPICEWWRKKP